MAKKPRENRIPVMMSNDELASIDSWQTSNNVATRSDTVRRLCKMALALDEELKPLHKSLNDLLIGIKTLIEATQPLVGSGSQKEDIVELSLRIMAVNMRALTHKNTVRKITGQSYAFKSGDDSLNSVFDESTELKSFFKEVINTTNESSDSVQKLEDMLINFGKVKPSVTDE